MFAHGPSWVLPSYSALLEQKSHFGRSATITSLTKNSLLLLESFDGLVRIAEPICNLVIGTEPDLPLFYQHTVPPNPPQEDIQMRSAERRALVVLGITAVIAAIFAAMLGVIWVQKANETSFFFNVPPVSSPIPHATYFPFDILEYWIIFWVAYAAFEFVYFSVDWFPTTWRMKSHKVATTLIGFYVVYISLFVPLIYLDVVYVTDPYQQSVLFAWIIVFIGILEMEFVRWAWGNNRGIIPRLIRRYRRWRHPLPGMEG